jgi:formate dehydrogenase
MDEHSAIRTRICPLCEAACGLTVEVDGPRIGQVRPNPQDVFSRGHSCPKGLGLASLHDDPDLLTSPLVRHGDEWREVSWTEAFDVIGERLPPLIADSRNACAVYLGNPYAHNLDLHLYGSAMLSALRTRNVFSAASVDSMPKHLSNGLMFGTSFGVPVPDIARTDLLLVLGSNLLVSNGSLMSAPGLPGKLRDLKRRGGRLVVVDPVRTRTAAAADEHLAIRPGADAYQLAAMVTVLAEEGLVRLGRAEGHVAGLDDVLEVLRPFTPEAVADRCGIEASTVRRLARELATTERAAVHGRIGTTTQEFGTLASWLVDVLNVLTGHLDLEGGVMFALPPGGGPNTRPPRGDSGWPHDRWRSRVRGAPELQGELPVACLAEEIDTPGEGRVRALITLAGNPARSVPHSARLEAAMASLDLMVAVDTYLNETTRHAHVILPAPRFGTRGHFDLTINQNASHNAARYSPPLVPLAAGEKSEREIMLRLAGIVRGDGWRVDVDRADDELAEKTARRLCAPLDVDPEEALRAVGPRRGAERLVDLNLRTGPYGDRFGAEDGLTLDVLLQNPDGVDLGPLRPRMPEVLRTPSGRVELAPPLIVADVDRLRAGLDEPTPPIVLLGRRQIRGMNSWLHNALPAIRSALCTLHVHPADAERIGLEAGVEARITSATGSLTAPVELTDTVPPGVVSLPHGWGHTGPHLKLSAAAADPGVNVNLLTDDDACEPLTQTPYFTGVPVEVAPSVRLEAGVPPLRGHEVHT